MRSIKARTGEWVAVFCLVALLLPLTTALAQTGKIAGTVVDAQTEEPLPGVNVVLVGTQQGATTNAEGNYTILNVQPGTYDVRASFIGYAQETVTGVEVNTDLTTTIDFQLQEETVGLEEVTVQAEERVVKADISSSRIDVSSEDIEDLPVTDVETVVGLQAGIRPDLNIRGGGRDEVDFRIDGLSLSGSRTNTPYTNISYTSVQQVQVQTGGFNAEYGNIRSGMINVVTKEGPRNRYTFDVMTRYSPAQKKHFGISPKDPNSYWMRPYMDDEVAWEGTEQWDDFTRKQYPDFVGYNKLSEQWNSDDNLQNDLSPEEIQQLFLWRHRRDINIDAPDYVIDASVGGPIPVVGTFLGDLRFFASYRQEESQYMVPLSRDGYSAYNGRIKLTSNVTPSIKLNLQQMWGMEEGTNCIRVGATVPCRFGERELTRTYDPNTADIFTPSNRSLSDVGRFMTALNWTHTLSPNTFYEVRLQRYATEYDAHPIRAGDTSAVRSIGSYPVDEAPFGYWFEARDGEVSNFDMGGHTSEFRDTSRVREWLGSFDVTSQIDQYNQVKAGLQFSAADNKIRYGHIDFLVNPDDVRASWNTTPIYGSAYLQDKIEYLGMIANVGLRLDYLNPNTQWWAYQDPFTEAFMGKNAEEMSQLLEKRAVDSKWKLSPRLGVSFPVTEASKLYFNWGQFVQYLEPEKMFMLERMQTTSGIWRISNPSTPMPQTTAYELGYEQSLFDKYLLRIAGYYKDIKNETAWVNFNSRSGLVDYQSNFPNQYRDVRGFEVSLYKNVGRWFRGFVNYTYQVETSGRFGLPEYFENPVQQRTFEQQFGANFPFKPVPQPYARISLDFLTPPEFGPSWNGLNPLGDWRLNFLGRWEAGDYFTYTGDIRAPNVVSNMQWEDYQMVDVRLMKNFTVGGSDAQFYIDVDNIFDVKNFNPGSFEGSRDFQNYLNSLRLPEEMVEDIPGWSHETGSDRPGTLDKDYIDPPNAQSFHYLWPRRVLYGLRFTF